LFPPFSNTNINFIEAYMIWNLIGSIGGKVLDIVDHVVEDPERDHEDAAAISGGGIRTED